MPVAIVVRRIGASSAELPPLVLDAPRVAIGRGSSCDVRLPDPSVSGRHASIRQRESGYVVVDEGSTNGTWLNGEKLIAQSPRALKSGDELRFGRVFVEVKLGASKPTTSNATEELAMALVARGLGEAQEGHVRLDVVAGPDAGEKLTLAGKKSATIGRDPRCTLRLSDRGVPPIGLEVVVEGARVKATPRDPRVPVKLAGRSLDVGVAAWWPNGAALELGGTTIVLDDPIARALDESAHGDDEKIALEPVKEVSAAAPPQEIAGPSPGIPGIVDVVHARPEDRPLPIPIVERRYDRRRSWRGATLAFEVVALILGLLILGASAAGLWWLLRK